MKVKSTLILSLMFILMFCTSTSWAQRSYVEVTITSFEKMKSEPALSDMPDVIINESPRIGLTWDAPAEWIESAGSSMRLATFIAGDDQKQIECSIVNLDGAAGGLEANIQRWLGQINLSLSSEQLLQFLNNQQNIKSKDGFPIKVIDFTELQVNESGQTPSMLAAVVSLGNMTVFVKMTGSVDAVQFQKSAFIKLCQSLAVN